VIFITGHDLQLGTYGLLIYTPSGSLFSPLSFDHLIGHAFLRPAFSDQFYEGLDVHDQHIGTALWCTFQGSV
jgi:hypothetical protein